MNRRLLAAGTALCAALTLVSPAWADGRDPAEGVWQTDGYGSVIDRDSAFDRAVVLLRHEK